jgi:hypothetical protein
MVMRRSSMMLLAALAALVLGTLALSSCAGAPAPAAPAATEKVYTGAGRAESLLAAMNAAKMDAVRKAVIDMIGVANERASSEKLQSVLYGTRNPNAYVVTDTMKTLRKDTDGQTGDYLFECSIAVRLEAVRSTLEANGLLGGETATPAEKTAAAGGESAAKTAAAAAKVDAPAGGSASGGAAAGAAASDLTPAEQKIIRDYVERMTWMVYFAEKSGMEPFYAKAAVGIANEYLASNTMEAVDLDQVEKLKSDKQKVYEAETGESISIVQWIAQKLNADAYIEIDGVVSGESTGKTHYGQASITLKAFESSTGRLLASAPWNSPKTMSTASAEAARINALQTSVYKAMPVAISQAKANMAAALRDGIPYELVVQKTPDSRLMSSFRRALRGEPGVKDVRSGTQSAEETRFVVMLVGTVDDLVDAVFSVSGKTPGLEGMKLVLSRGKSVTFTTGM